MLDYALRHDSLEILLIKDRKADRKRGGRHTNRYTLGHLFPQDDEVLALKRELASLSVFDYLETLVDCLHPYRPAWRVFGKAYESGDVYIKLRVNLINEMGPGPLVMIMSFHYALYPFGESDFPHRE